MPEVASALGAAEEAIRYWVDRLGIEFVYDWQGRLGFTAPDAARL